MIERARFWGAQRAEKGSRSFVEIPPKLVQLSEDLWRGSSKSIVLLCLCVVFRGGRGWEEGDGKQVAVCVCLLTD